MTFKNKDLMILETKFHVKKLSKKLIRNLVNLMQRERERERKLKRLKLLTLTKNRILIKKK